MMQLDIADCMNMLLFGSLLTVGTVGFVAGVLFPFAFRLIGYITDVVRKIVKG